MALSPPGDLHHVGGRVHNPVDLLRQRLECPEHFGLIGVPVIGSPNAFDLVAKAPLGMVRVDPTRDMRERAVRRRSCNVQPLTPQT